MKKYRIEECSNGWIVYIVYQSGTNENVRGRFVFNNIKDALNLIHLDQTGENKLDTPF